VPELPEVETVCRGLAPFMEGARITHVDQRRADLRFPFPDGFAERLTGRTVERLNRRAKYALATLSGGDVLVMHLGMSGRFTVRPSNDGMARTPGRFVHDVGGIAAHDHVVFGMSNGSAIIYNDPRRFGYMDLVSAGDVETHKYFAGLGVEPLSNAFSAPYLAHRGQGRTQDLKAFLLDQRIVAGLGNIYVCEALFRARLSPRRKAGTLANRHACPTQAAQRLAPAVRDVLDAAIRAGGSSLRDYAHADGSLGYFQQTFSVYGRQDYPCRREGCNGTVKRIVQAGRSTFFCGQCQR